MPLVNFSDLDYDQIKTSIKDYLRSNSNFTDYDFDGSNLSTIIDVLAYNTYITSYNANMLSNEVFIDSATLRENVVSLARNIGYVPRSARAPIANVSFFVDATDFTTPPELVTLHKGPIGTTEILGRDAFTFNVLDDVVVPINDDLIAFFENVAIVEGAYLTTTFTVDSFDPDQRFILPNANIDTSTIRVNVKPSAGSQISRKYIQADSLFNVTPTSPVYWVQEVEDERYELIFGDGVYGIKLESPSLIEVSYVVTNGSAANGASSFSFGGKVTDTRLGGAITAGVSLITTNTPAFGGQEIESISSVKKYASRIYASQNRAVTASDYEAIIPTIYHEAESVAAFGGEELDPPQFGKVFITIKPVNGAFLSSAVKQNLLNDVKKYSVAGIMPEIIDLKYLYIEPTVNAYYNSNVAKSLTHVEESVTNNIQKYADSEEVNKFGARFKYSKFLKVVDDSADSITSNITTIEMRRDLRPVVNSFAEYEICFGNRFYIKNHGHGTHGGQIGYNIKSSGFYVSGIFGTVYLADSPNQDLKTGVVNLIQLDSPNQARIIKRNAGVVDYIKGEVKLSPIMITGTVMNEGFPLIQVSAVPYSNDVIGLQDLYIQLDMRYTGVTAKADNIASGNDISGSNYEVTSSFANGSLVRGPVLLANQTTQSVRLGLPAGSVNNTSPTTSTTTTTTTRTTSSTPSSTSSTSTSTQSSGYSY